MNRGRTLRRARARFRLRAGTPETVGAELFESFGVLAGQHGGGGAEPVRHAVEFDGSAFLAGLRSAESGIATICVDLPVIGHIRLLLLILANDGEKPVLRFGRVWAVSRCGGGDWVRILRWQTSPLALPKGRTPTTISGPRTFTPRERRSSRRPLRARWGDSSGHRSTTTIPTMSWSPFSSGVGGTFVGFRDLSEGNSATLTAQMTNLIAGRSISTSTPYRIPVARLEVRSRRFQNPQPRCLWVVRSPDSLRGGAGGLGGNSRAVSGAPDTGSFVRGSGRDLCSCCAEPAQGLSSQRPSIDSCVRGLSNTGPQSCGTDNCDDRRTASSLDRARRLAVLLCSVSGRSFVVRITMPREMSRCAARVELFC